jgi:hypothetical protein
MCVPVYVLLDEIYFKNTEGNDIICSLKRHKLYDVSCLWTTDSRQCYDTRSANRPVNMLQRNSILYALNCNLQRKKENIMKSIAWT